MPETSMASSSFFFSVQLQDDDNGNNSIAEPPDGADDEFQYNVVVKGAGGHVVAGGGWQRVSIPLSDFFDDNSYHWGGNGILDPFPTSVGGNGQLINVVVTVIGNNGGDTTFVAGKTAGAKPATGITAARTVDAG